MDQPVSVVRMPTQLRTLCYTLALAGATSLCAQTAITTVVTNIVDFDDVTRTGVTATGATSGFSVLYRGDEARITSFSTGTNSYTPVASGQAYARRNDSTPNFPIVNGNLTGQWNATLTAAAGPGVAPTNGSTRTVRGRYFNTMESLFTSQNLWTGTENLFVNDDTSGGGTNVVNNIERMDFIFSGGLTSSADKAFAIFERGRGTGGNGANGGFKVAVITGLDVNGVPNAFSDTVITVTDNNYGITDLATVRYDVYRNESVSSTQLNFLNNADIGAQGIAGVVVPTSLFVANNVTVYGYAVLGEDVVVTSGVSGAGASLVDWNNASVYPRLSGFNNDVDMVATGATMFSTVPEPSVVSLTLGAAALGLGLWSRRRQAAP